MEKKEKGKMLVIDYYFNFHASSSLDIIYDDMKLFLILIYLIAVFIKLSSVTC